MNVEIHSVLGFHHLLVVAVSTTDLHYYQRHRSNLLGIVCIMELFPFSYDAARGQGSREPAKHIVLILLGRTSYLTPQRFSLIPLGFYISNWRDIVAIVLCAGDLLNIPFLFV